MTDQFLERLTDGSALAEVDNLEIDTSRPWGGYAVMPPGAQRAKLMSFHGETSLHFHREKDELYLVGCGEGVVYRGLLHSSVRDTIAHLVRTIIRGGDVLRIPRGVVHALASSQMVLMDAAFGEDPREEDIVRVYDRCERTDVIEGLVALPAELQGQSLVSLFHIVRTPVDDQMRSVRQSVADQSGRPTR
jgi:mannose-6-phosphate isomerase-like protein (cupin superfamily)